MSINNSHNIQRHGNYFFKIISTLLSCLIIFLPTNGIGATMISNNYSSYCLDINHGSGSRLSTNYQISSDTISIFTTDPLSSDGYLLSPGSLSRTSQQLRGSLYINNDQPLTSSLLCPLE